MTPEFSRPVAIGRLPPEGREERLVASPAERAALALRFGIPAVNRFTAELRLVPEAGGGVAIGGTLAAEVVQDCVVTLEPVTQQVEETVRLRILGPEEVASDDPETPDEVEAPGGVADLGEALAEQLSLALDPYPRAPGAELPGAAPEPDPEPPARNPFAALSALKGRK